MGRFTDPMQDNKDHEDAQAMRCLRADIRSQVDDWPEEERDGFNNTLHRYIGKKNTELEKLRTLVREMLDHNVDNVGPTMQDLRDYMEPLEPAKDNGKFGMKPYCEKCGGFHPGQCASAIGGPPDA